ncbi:proteasome inhibitor PI31 subunit [Drosophila gunungcola]|uniref:Proteasome inhibitor PI31 subunit n=1 Tax=Drosophila gunungcola TaxID=103775 RepID=A0A9P9YBQ4_9MUSC|nr:proteasome inhibitor PI31 subunit [Drosophila gunungcola]KAI8034059.1 hypothetical protein M5D96_013219 [Drosophila gunungcola]
METPETTSSSDLSQISLQSLEVEGAGKTETKTESDAEIEPCDWQSLFHSIQPNIRKRSDLLMALAHFLITKEYRLRSIKNASDFGAGGSTITSTSTNTSELLPKNWNRDAHRYAMHYIDELGNQYVLLAKLSRKDLVISLQNSTSKRMSIACLQPENLVKSTSKSYLAKCIPKAEKMINRLRFDLVDPVVRGTKRTADGPFFAQEMIKRKKLLLQNSQPSRVTFNLSEKHPCTRGQ